MGNILGSQDENYLWAPRYHVYGHSSHYTPWYHLAQQHPEYIKHRQRFPYLHRHYDNLGHHHMYNSALWRRHVNELKRRIENEHDETDLAGKTSAFGYPTYEFNTDLGWTDTTYPHIYPRTISYIGGDKLVTK